ncbi:MAG: hypothetical protein RMI94_09215 [Bryobacterales bacterium]|nr:hypothetical protein [Bryobacterales bacterium]
MPGARLVAVGDFPETLLAELSRRSGLPRMPGRFDPAPAWDPARGQCDSTRLILALRARYALPVVGATTLDLFIPVFSFVFGEAELGGRAAVFSIHRLREEFYGLPPDPGRLVERALRELLHELGHMAGLVHCHEAACVMRPSHSVEQVDARMDDYCESCWSLIGQRRAMARVSEPPPPESAPLR